MHEQQPVLQQMDSTEDAKTSPAEDWTLLKQLLEDRTRMYFEAINNRNFDATRPPWTFAAPQHFTAGLTISGQLKTAASVVDTWKEYTSRHPSYHVQITGISSALGFYKHGGFAEVYINFTMTGDTEGVVREAICKSVWRYHRKAAEWNVSYTESFLGMDCTAPW